MKKPKIIFSIIFTIFTVIVCSLSIFMYRLDNKYGTEVQGQQENLEHYGANAYLKDTCKGDEYNEKE